MLKAWLWQDNNGDWCVSTRDYQPYAGEGLLEYDARCMGADLTAGIATDLPRAWEMTKGDVAALFHVERGLIPKRVLLSAILAVERREG